MKLVKLRNYANERYRANYLTGSICYYIPIRGKPHLKIRVYREDTYEDSRDLQEWVRP